MGKRNHENYQIDLGMNRIQPPEVKNVTEM